VSNPTLETGTCATCQQAAIVAELLAITDPIERAARITAYGRPFGTLPSALAEARKADLAAARKTLSASKLAKRVRIARSGITRLAPTVATTRKATTS